MKTLTLAAIRCSLIFTAVAALSLAYPASVQAVPTTYQYTGNPFTFVTGSYTTSDFVTARVTLAGPLGANMPLTEVTPTAFILTDGLQAITNREAGTFVVCQFATDADGAVTRWAVEAVRQPTNHIATYHTHGSTRDEASVHGDGIGNNFLDPGRWVRVAWTSSPEPPPYRVR
jgi:hypothetical protein